MRECAGKSNYCKMKVESKVNQKTNFCLVCKGNYCNDASRLDVEWRMTGFIVLLLMQCIQVFRGF